MNEPTVKQSKWKFEVDTENAIGFGLMIGNSQPKKKYATALWQIAIVFLCFVIRVTWSYHYKNRLL